jgi:hypothetical protein
MVATARFREFSQAFLIAPLEWMLLFKKTLEGWKNNDQDGSKYVIQDKRITQFWRPL